MSRVVQFLAGVTVVAAASANVDCGSATSCTSCVGTAPAQACVTYDVPAVPTCAGCGAGIGSPPLCSAATASTTNCYICVPVLGGLVGACVMTNVNVAPYLSANSTISSGLAVNLFGEANLVTAVTASGNYDVPAGNAVVVLASASPIVNLNAAATNNNIFQVNSSLTVNSWNSLGSAKVNNDNGGELKVNQLTIGTSSKFVVSQERASASAAAAPSVTFGSINFGTQGTLRVSGGAAHFGGSATVSNNITGSGRVQLSGAVSVDGIIPSTVTVNVDASGASAPLVSIETGATFNVSGDIKITRNGESPNMGVDTKAVIAVNGVLVAGSASTTVQPKVLLNQGASFVISSAATFRAEAVDISEKAFLVIDRNVNRASLRIQQIARCAGTIQIRLTAEAFLASTVSSTSSSTTGSVAFSYSSTNNVTELVKCGVEVFDASNRKYTLTSRTSAQAAAGRRLLASEGTATWGSDSMTIQMEKQSSSASVSFAVVPLLMVGMAGLLF